MLQHKMHSWTSKRRDKCVCFTCSRTFAACLRGCKCFREVLCLTSYNIVILNSPRYTHTHPFNGPFSGTTQVSQYQKGKTDLDFTEARDSEWQWHQLDHMQVCILLQTDNHASTSPLSFLQAGCPSCRPTNSVKALKAPRYTVAE